MSHSSWAALVRTERVLSLFAQSERLQEIPVEPPPY